MNKTFLQYKPFFFLSAAVVGMVIAGVLLFSGPAVSQRGSVANSVKEIESALSLPKGSHPLSSYNRFYVLGEGQDKGFIIGVFRYNPVGVGEIHVVPYKSLPTVFDGGCNVLMLRYSQRDGRVESIECNGES
jgi:hypothetical protein